MEPWAAGRDDGVGCGVGAGLQRMRPIRMGLGPDMEMLCVP